MMIVKQEVEQVKEEEDDDDQYLSFIHHPFNHFKVLHW
jgi:hypothetical protein